MLLSVRWFIFLSLIFLSFTCGHLLFFLSAGGRRNFSRPGERELPFQIRNDFRVFGILGQVMPFVGIFDMIVEFSSGFSAIPFSVAPPFVAEAVAHDAGAAFVPDL